MELGPCRIVDDITVYNSTTVLTRPKKVKVPMWNQYTTRKLDTRSRTECDLGSSVEVPQHRLLGDRAKGSIVSSPWIVESTNVVDMDVSLVSVDIEW